MNEFDKCERSRLEEPTSVIEEAIEKYKNELWEDREEVSKAMIDTINDDPILFADLLNDGDLFLSCLSNRIDKILYNQAEKEINND